MQSVTIKHKTNVAQAAALDSKGRPICGEDGRPVVYPAASAGHVRTYPAAYAGALVEAGCAAVVGKKTPVVVTVSAEPMATPAPKVESIAPAKPKAKAKAKK